MILLSQIEGLDQSAVQTKMAAAHHLSHYHTNFTQPKENKRSHILASCAYDVVYLRSKNVETFLYV